MMTDAAWNLDEVLRELVAERFGPTDRMRPTAFAATDTPEAFAHRRRVLNEALDGPPDNVIPLHRDNAA
jgi:hypothetical protein